MRRSRSALGFGAACAAALVLGSTTGAAATSAGRDHLRGVLESRILYLQHDNPAQFSTYLGSIAYDGSAPSGITNGPELNVATLSEDRGHVGVGSTAFLMIATTDFGSEHELNSAGSDSPTQMAMTPTTNVLVAGTIFDGASPAKVVALGPGEGDALVTLLDDQDFPASPFWAIGADDDRALVLAQTTQLTYLTAALDGSGFKHWPGWVGAWQAPRNGPVLALKRVRGGFRILRLAHGAETTTRVADLPADDVHGGSWSARGNRFVLVARSGGADKLVMVDRAGTKVTVLRRQPGAGVGFSAPTLSSNGKLLAYQVLRDHNPRTAGLWVRDLGQARSCRLVAWSDVGRPRAAFSPDSSRVVVSGAPSAAIRGSVRLDRPRRPLEELDLPKSELVGFVGGSSQPIDAKPCAR